ncbi:MAG: hypothetical protein FMNOHCHN_01803 [Ignavibacteriaceae bacterium]|nr:hypothetical protein [Ignavibacteriaceae bacterium]
MKILTIFFLAVVYIPAQSVNTDTAYVPEYKTDEVIIYGKSDTKKDKIPYHTPESALEKLTGINLISRGPLGLEPLINGFGDGPVTVTVDGMKMHGACVDKMDPVSSYIEPENLGKIAAVTSGSQAGTASGTAGAINFVTLKPDFATPFSLASDNYYESNGGGSKTGTVLNFSEGDFALRSSFTWRRASDYSAGKSVYIRNSSFTKLNYKADAAYRISEDDVLTLSYLADDARDVGYPALIMDARSAKASLVSIDLSGERWSPFPGKNSFRLYFNSVNHIMDDYSRPLSEINSRIVMPGMYMPMTGKFETTGLLYGTVITDAQSVLSVNLGLTSQFSFADMKMISTGPWIPEMYLLNLGDAREQSALLSASYNREFFEDIYITLSGSAEQTFRKLTRKDAADLNTIYEPGFTPEAEYFLPSASADLKYIYSSDWTAGMQLSYNTRAPLFTESYGYFLFSPLDNAFYAGNSRLRKEQSLRIGLETVRSFEHLDLSIKAFHLRFFDYIAGEHLPDKEFNVGIIPFKQYINAGSAYTNGITASAEFDYHTLDGAVSVTWQEGYSEYFNDNLPFMAPVTAEMALRYSEEKWYVKLQSAGTLKQKRVSSVLSHEKELPGHLILSAEAAYTMSDLLMIYITAENLTDAYYVTRFSVNNFPAKGRNARLGVRLSYE